MTISLTLAQITELAGGRMRRMKQLAGEDVFIPIDEERASRAPRNYTLSEAAIAIIIVKLDRLNIASRTLREIADALRWYYAAGEVYGLSSYEEGSRLVMRELYLRNKKSDEGSPAQRRQVLEAFGLDREPEGKPQLSDEEIERVKGWAALERARVVAEPTDLAVAVTEDGWQFWIGAIPRRDEPLDMFIVLRLETVLSVLR